MTIAARIRALLAKTVQNGCTEEEAMSAAAKAGELMDRHGLTMSAIELKQEGCKTGTVEAGGRKIHEVCHAAFSIARFCNVKVWLSTDSRTRNKTLTYFGMPQDVEIAGYLTDLVRAALESEFKTYLRSPARTSGVHGRTLRASFMRGMAYRISQRLDTMRAARDAVTMSDGRALVVVKDALVEEAFAKIGINLRNGATSKYRGDLHAYHAGKEAGDRVALNPGINAGASPLGIDHA